MCGISLIIRKHGATFDGKTALQKMMEAQKHRGPDGAGQYFLEWDTEEIHFGHNLLAISESPEKARQPLLSEDEACGLIFNGEIYNHKEIRQELEEEGVRFRTGSDSETLLQWLKHHGRKGLRRLEGMYAFVYWDSHRQLLLIHRDGYGIKPLYYARNRHFLVFASEPGALIASGLFSFPVDTHALPWYLRYKFVPVQVSPWIGIRQVLPGEAIEFWEGKPMHYQVAREGSKPVSQTIRQAMDRAFSSVIPSDQEVGLMFSGGIDSSLILKWCLDQGIRIRVFSIRFRFGTEWKADQEVSEQIARQLKVPIHWVDVDVQDLNTMPELFSAPVSLIADSAVWLTRKIASAAREAGIKILLSGAGADEWFGGYRRHWFFYQIQRYFPLIPESLRKLAFLKLKIGKLKWLDLPSGLTAADVWDLAVSSPLAGLASKQNQIPLPGPEFGTETDRALVWDQRHYLIQDILTLTDQATMALGVEGRFPFLHPELTAFADEIPGTDRLAKGRKWILKKEMESWAGLEVTSRRKQGFGVPLNDWFLTEVGKTWLENSLDYLDSQLPGFWNKPAFDRFRKALVSHAGSMGQERLTLCVLASWLSANQERSE